MNTAENSLAPLNSVSDYLAALVCAGGCQRLDRTLKTVEGMPLPGRRHHFKTLVGCVRWLVAATSGNICGGVLIVSLLNYGQVKKL